MSIVWTASGLSYLSLAQMGQSLWSSLDFCLYKSNITPARSDVSSTYLGAGVEATFTGYTRQNVANTAWSGGTFVGNIWSNVGPQVQFTSGPSLSVSNTIYGMFVVLHGQTVVLCAEIFPAPFTVNANGQVIVYTPTFTWYSTYP